MGGMNRPGAARQQWNHRHRRAGGAQQDSARQPLEEQASVCEGAAAASARRCACACPASAAPAGSFRHWRCQMGDCGPLRQGVCVLCEFIRCHEGDLPTLPCCRRRCGSRRKVHCTLVSSIWIIGEVIRSCNSVAIYQF